MNHLPGNNISTTILTPSLLDIEKLIQVYSLSIFKKDKRGYIIYHQRAILISTDNNATIERDIKPILDKINKHENTEFFSEILSFDSMIESKSNKKPFDSKIIHIQSPFVLAKKSPSTNIVYPEDKKFCPDSGRKLHYCISTTVSIK